MKAGSLMHVHAPMTSVSGVTPVTVLLLLLRASASSFRADDDDNGDDVSSLPGDEGSGPDDEDLSYLFSDVMESDVTFRCYRCTGITELSGCNVTSLRENPADYVTECDGHCLNISTADSTVFDCTDNVPLRSAKCFQNDGILMCVCASDFCNGPAPAHVMPLPSSRRHLNLTDLPKVNVTSRDLDLTLSGSDAPEQNVTVTSRNLSVTRQNVTSGRSFNTTSSEVWGVTPPRLNSTSSEAGGDSSPSRLDATSDQVDVTSRRKNPSSEEAGVLTSRRLGDVGGGGDVMLPETFEQRQRNGTVIEAASRSGGERATLCGPCVVWVVGVMAMIPRLSLGVENTVAQGS